MSGNKRSCKSSVEFPSQAAFEDHGKILKWVELEQGGENIYHIRRYFENTKSKFETKSIILEMAKENSPVLKAYCSGNVAEDICTKWENMDKGQNMFLRPNGTAVSEEGFTYNVADIVIR